MIILRVVCINMLNCMWILKASMQLQIYKVGGETWFGYFPAWFSTKQWVDVANDKRAK